MDLLAYAGLWMDPLLEDLDAFINNTQKNVNGKVKVKLHKGSMRVVEGHRLNHSTTRI